MANKSELPFMDKQRLYSILSELTGQRTFEIAQKWGKLSAYELEGMCISHIRVARANTDKLLRKNRQLQRRIEALSQLNLFAHSEGGSSDEN